KAFDRDYKIAPNGQQIVYSEGGDLWLADPDFENARELVASDEQEYNPVWGPESNRMAVVQDGDVWIFNIKTAKLQKITNKKEEEARYSISEWARPHKLILRQYDDSADKTYYFPEYVHEYVQTGATQRGFDRQIISVAYL